MLMVGGTHDRHNSAPELAEQPPYQIMLDRSLYYLCMEMYLFWWRKGMFFVNFQVTIQIFRWLFKILVSWMAGWLIPCSNAVE